MKTFDFETAWHTTAKPAYESLPVNVRELFERTARLTADLHQSSDLQMPWPTADDDHQSPDVTGVLPFREAFRAVPSDVLAFAARVIYYTGHWYPTSAKGYEMPGRNTGASWKFSHYADQELRERLNIASERGHAADHGLSIKVIEGAIRVSYGDRDNWFWEEIAPATEDGLKAAQRLRRVCEKVQEPKKADRVGMIDALIHNKTYQQWPASWLLLVRLDAFMLDEDVIKARRQAVPENRAKIRARLIADAAQAIANEERRRDGKLWLLDHGLSIENVIYYSHTNRFCFGWDLPVSPVVESTILDVISEFPYSYDIKTQDGRTLSGG